MPPTCSASTQTALLPDGYETQLTDNVTDPIPPGLKQRIAIARVLANKPRIIPLTTLTGGWTSAVTTRSSPCSVVCGRARRYAVIISDDRNILRLADREFILHKGQLLENLTPGQ